MSQESWNVPLGIEDTRPAAEHADTAADEQQAGEALPVRDVVMTEAAADGAAQGTSAQAQEDDAPAGAVAVLTAAATGTEGVAQPNQAVAAASAGAAAPCAEPKLSGGGNMSSGGAGGPAGETADERLGGGEAGNRVLGESKNGCNTAAAAVVAACQKAPEVQLKAAADDDKHQVVGTAGEAAAA